ncbi:MAG: 30S ribosomal protein S6, partial [Planctomycetaceae bacterium]|nr:30S ribosomal protein S6 [Planctomycetaceae bacterium]
MSATVYECMHILDSNRYARDPSGVQESVDSTVAKFDGEILVSRLWNEQKLAYLVNGHRKGTYWLSYIRVEGSRLVEMERAFQLNENVLRTLTLRLDERLVEPMV